MMSRYELSPAYARQLFRGTSGIHPANYASAFLASWITRGGVRW